MKTKKPTRTGNINLAVFFLAGILILIIFSFLVKTFLEINDSKFSNKTPTNILIEGESPSVLSFVPSDNRASVITLDKNYEKDKAEDFLGLRITAGISSDEDLTKGIKDIASELLFSYSQFETDLNFFDRVRVFLFVKSLDSDSIHEVAISSERSPGEIDKIVYPLTSEKRLEEEGQSIEIVNASGADGLGNNVGRVVANAGGNVVLVTTSQKISEDSWIGYKGEKSYTANQLSEILRLEAREYDGDSIGNVIIMVGKDWKDR